MMKLQSSVDDSILDEVDFILDHLKSIEAERKQRIHDQWASSKLSPKKPKGQTRSDSHLKNTISKELNYTENEEFDINRYPGKKTLDSKKWDKLKSTAYGYFFDKEGNYYPKLLSEMKKEESK